MSITSLTLQTINKSISLVNYFHLVSHFQVRCDWLISYKQMFPKTLIISWLVFHPHTKTPAYCILWLRGSYCVLWSNVACGMEKSKLYFISIHDRVKLISQLDLTLLHSYQQSTCNGEGDVRQTIYSPDWIIFPMEGFRGSSVGDGGFTFNS